jgi:hypothetical protein
MEVSRLNAATSLEYYYKATNFVTGMIGLWKVDARYAWTTATPEYFRQSITDWTCDQTKYHVKHFMVLLRIAEPEFFEFVFGTLVLQQYPFTHSEKVSEMLYLKMMTRQKELELRQLKRLHKEAIRALKENEKREKAHLARLATMTLIPLPRTSQTQE